MAIVSFLETVDHDLALVDGTLVLCKDARAICQHVEARLRLFLGEWFLDQREGVPYFQDVFIKDPNIPLVKSLLSNVVSGTPGVVTITEAAFEFDPDERRLYYTLSFMTDASEDEQTLDNSLVLGDQ